MMPIKKRVKTEAAKAIDKATETSDNNFFTQSIRSIAKMMAGKSAIDEVIEPALRIPQLYRML